MSIVSVLEKTIVEKGIEAGIAHYRDLKANQAATYDFAEPELNQLGYLYCDPANRERRSKSSNSTSRHIRRAPTPTTVLPRLMSL
jgi:hypothetical protein